MRVEFDRTEVVLPCPLGMFLKDSDNPCLADFKPIRVHTVVESLYKQPFILKYEVSGGRIVGQGENVYWNLEGVRPGTYHLSVSLDYGRGFSPPEVSETAELKDTCCCLPRCECPDVVFENEGIVRTGSETCIKAKIGDGTTPDYEYEWSVEGGQIISGQDTSNIVVKAADSGVMRIFLTFSHTFLCANCLRDFSTEIEVKP